MVFNSTKTPSLKNPILIKKDVKLSSNIKIRNHENIKTRKTTDKVYSNILTIFIIYNFSSTCKYFKN